MAVNSPSIAVRLTGTEQVDPKGRQLRAGALSAVLDNGALRYIKVNGIEVIRAIAFLVRDENWGTFTPAISNLEVSEGGSAFTVSYDATCADAKRSIAYKAKITAAADGSLTFVADALPQTDVLTNRTGFIVLHPLKGVAGEPLTVEHVDGRLASVKFPAVIDPDCPFRDVRALTHQVQPGLAVTCRMEGDTFEMEDHRNWTDASFKTYVRPLALPWPYTLPAGKPFRQQVSLTFSATLPEQKATSGGGGLKVSVGAATGTTMPRIGLGVAADEAAPSVAAAALVKKIGPQVLVCQLDGRRSDNEVVARHYKALADATGAAVTLEIIIPGSSAAGAAATEIAPIAAAVAAAGLKPADISITPAAHLKAVLPGSKGPDCVTHADMYAAARAAFPGLPLGGGMFSFFTELNRIRPPAALLDFVTHTVAPIVHAADDVSVMETLESHPYIIHSTRQFAGGKPYRVGPSAVPARDNPYGKASAENPGNGRVCLSRMDPRQRGLFGAAWLFGYIAGFARGGLDVVSVGAPTGPSGLIARKTDYSQPYFDDTAGAAVYPAFHVVAGLTRAAGRPLRAITLSDEAKVAGLAYDGDSGTTLWLANLTDADQSVAVSGVEIAGARVHKLNDRNFEQLTTVADYLDLPGEVLKGGEPVRLHPYAVICIGAARRRRQT